MSIKTFRVSLQSLCLLVLFLMVGCSSSPKESGGSAGSEVERKQEVKPEGLWSVTLPESDVVVVLNDKDEKDKRVTGHYKNGDDRGSVSVLYGFTVAKHNDGKPETLFAPFVVSPSGSGIFYYLGSFLWSDEKRRIVLTDYYFLGDRIKPEMLTLKGPQLTMEFRDHSLSQAMVESPDLLKKVVCEVENSKLSKCHY